jgi:hypothetical protein
MIASGRSRSRDTPARYARSVLFSSPIIPALWKAARSRPTRSGAVSHAKASARSASVSLTTGEAVSTGRASSTWACSRPRSSRPTSRLRKSAESARLLGRTLNEAPPVRVPRQVERVQMEAVAEPFKRSATLSPSAPRVFSRPPTRYSRPSRVKEPNARPAHHERRSRGGIRGQGRRHFFFSGLHGRRWQRRQRNTGTGAAKLAAKEEGAGASGGKVPLPFGVAACRHVPTIGRHLGGQRALSAGCTLRAYSLASWPWGKRTRRQSTPRAMRRSATLAAPRSPASSRSKAIRTRSVFARTSAFSRSPR